MSITSLKSDLLGLAGNAQKMTEEMERQDDQAAKVLWANTVLAIEDALQQIDAAQREYRASA